eukprot:Plantae.Rhodophyta-Hildenbrandia_rubra.ctg12738.p1 GENE.Plantae.Rhodophyta-Hildenbrandia_rubra.ctg12738~~Plantae.Rhodophyta-Hildenbrandia_rubra.ctg12738.p1  ORF type:complete len:115 (-),score=2.46 Plantae.Rhodophyta-Hildenbrandia_rubra.ctg12738:216-560(-)
MLDAGAISPSRSPWALPFAADAKPDGAQWLCANFRPLSSRMSRDAWPMPNGDDLLQSLSGAKHRSTLDLFSGCWQIRLDEQVKHANWLAKCPSCASEDYDRAARGFTICAGASG